MGQVTPKLSDYHGQWMISMKGCSPLFAASLRQARWGLSELLKHRRACLHRAKTLHQARAIFIPTKCIVVRLGYGNAYLGTLTNLLRGEFVLRRIRKGAR